MGLKVIIYHRSSSIESEEESKRKIEGLVKMVDSNYAIKIITERADKLENQIQLENIIRYAKADNVKMLYCYSLHTLVASNFITSLEKLTELIKLDIKVYFHDFDSMMTFEMCCLYNRFKIEKDTEMNNISAYKTKLNHAKTGRPKIDIDIEKMCEMRESGLSYAEIARNFECSLQLIHSRMPVHLRKLLPDKVRNRMRKLEERINEKIRLDKDKLNE